MRKVVVFLMFVFFNSLNAQKNKEVIFLYFDKSKEKCKIEVESTNKSPEGFLIVDMYKKVIKEKKVIFKICDEKFFFNLRSQKKDTFKTKSLKDFQFKTINYIKEKHQKGKDFKHQTFKKINIIEKISNDKVVKYFNVYWCCEWMSE